MPESKSESKSGDPLAQGRKVDGGQQQANSEEKEQDTDKKEKAGGQGENQGSVAEKGNNDQEQGNPQVDKQQKRDPQAEQKESEKLLTFRLRVFMLTLKEGGGDSKNSGANSQAGVDIAKTGVDGKKKGDGGAKAGVDGNKKVDGADGAGADANKKPGDGSGAPVGKESEGGNAAAKQNEPKVDQEPPEEKVKRLAPGSEFKMTPVTSMEFKDVTEADFGRIQLGDIRSRIAPVIDDFFRFTDHTGAVAQDGEALVSYLALSGTTGQFTASEPVVVYIMKGKRGVVSQAGLLDKPPFVLKFIQKLEDNGSRNEGTLHSSLLPQLKGGLLRLSEIRKYIKAMSADAKNHHFCDDEGYGVDDGVTLKEYAAALTGTIDEDARRTTTPSITLYFCKPGIQIKPKPVSKGASQTLKSDEALKPQLGLTKIPDATRDKTMAKLEDLLDTAKFQVTAGGEYAKSASRLTEDEWHLVVRNCNMMFGWTVDVNKNKIVRAPKAAFRLRDGLNLDTVPSAALAPAPPSSSSSTASASSSSPTPSSTAIAKDKEAASTIPKIQYAKKAQAIPTFTVEDNSRIEVTMIKHEFQTSMAKVHFSASSLEASVSGGYGPVSVGVSGGVSQESTETAAETVKKSEKTMVGTYYFPRAAVYLGPGDLVPTEEFAKAIHKIRTNKNIADLRQLHRDFGHLFCRKVVIGGCLQTTKVLTVDEASTETTVKDQFKASVGIAVETPYVSASVKTSKEDGKSQSLGSQTIDAKDRLIFEATGGNTILATSTIDWTKSLADFSTWRVIEQDQLTSLADALGQIPGYLEVQKWFAQAVPALSRYLDIPQSRVVNVRLKALLDKPGITTILGTGAHKYLGHDRNQMFEPIHIVLGAKDNASLDSDLAQGHMEGGRLVLDVTAFTEEKAVKLNQAHPALFSPKKTQAPLLLSYNGKLGLEEPEKKEPDGPVNLTDRPEGATKETDKKKGNNPAGARESHADANRGASGAEEKAKAFASAYLQTVWRLEAPDGEYLSHGSRVTIRSLATNSNPALTVYRNQQGVYLPTMSSHEGPSFWRVLKCNSTSRDGSPIKDGEKIRLSWRFSDQSSGYRDFYDDTFGRRRFNKPDEASDALYLKVPFPSFQFSQSQALVMSFSETVKPVVEQFNVLAYDGNANTQASYNLHDISFRLDSVGEDKMGEANDYMAPSQDGAPIAPDASWHQQGTEMKAPALMIRNVLLPGTDGPVGAQKLRSILF